MIPSVDEKMPFKRVQKLKQVYDHYRQKCKIAYIKRVVNLYNIHDTFGEIDLYASTWNGLTETWEISWEPGEHTRGHIVEQIMSKTEFHNFPNNENVYFYRYLNVFFNEFGWDHKEEIIEHLRTSNDAVMTTNLKEYTDYQEKIIDLKNMLGL